MMMHYEPGLTVELVRAYRRERLVYILTIMEDTGPPEVHIFETHKYAVANYNDVLREKSTRSYHEAL